MGGVKEKRSDEEREEKRGRERETKKKRLKEKDTNDKENVYLLEHQTKKKKNRNI